MRVLAVRIDVLDVGDGLGMGSAAEAEAIASR